MQIRRLLCLLCWLALIASPLRAYAQQVQFGQPSTISPPSIGGSSTISPPTFTAPGGVTSAPLTSSPLSTTPRFGTPTFTTPTTPGFGSTPAPTFASPQPSTMWPGGTSPFGTAPTTISPYGAYPQLTPPAGTYGASPYGQQPGVLFPQGVWSPSNEYVQETFRILQHPRISETYLYADNDPQALGINDIEFAVTAAIPNFFGSTQPLYITPTYIQSLWQGPNSIPADLPPNAYSAFLDFFFASDPNRPLGFEVGVAVGAYTDFNTFNDHSIRVTGEGFGVVRLTPTLTFKAGVWYLNRNDLKLLPAGGLVWEPNPQTKVDILFPNPKFSRYLSTIGTTDLWYYVSAEYGGGAWTIERADGSSDRVDINDIRIKLGIDWINQRSWRGYFEVGYVCDRQVIYVVNPSDNFTADNTFLIGAGFAF